MNTCRLLFVVATTATLCVPALAQDAAQKPKEKPAVTIVQETTRKVTDVANVTQGYTQKVVAQYQAELRALAQLREETKKAIEAEADQEKKQQYALEFYRKQKSYLEKMQEDVEFTDGKLDELYGRIRSAMGGYSKSTSALDKESATHKVKEELITKRNNLRNNAGLLIEEKKRLPRNEDGTIDQTTEAWFAFADKEDALLLDYKDVQDELKRSEWKLRFYGQVKTALGAHKTRAAQWSGKARSVSRKYKSLRKDIDTQLEIVNDMIALGNINSDLAAIASLDKLSGEVDGLVDGISKMGLLTDIEIAPPPTNGEGGKEDLTLEKIAAGNDPAPTTPSDRDRPQE